LFQFFRALDYLLAALGKNFAREFPDRSIAAGAPEIVLLAQPVAARKPERRSHDQSIIALAFDGALCLLEAFRAPCFERFFESRHPLLSALFLLHGFDALADEHIEVARRTELLGEPFQLRLYPPGFPISEQPFEDGHRRAHSPKSDAHLMDALAIFVS